MTETGAVHDPVNHPTHYTSHPSGLEVITLTRLLPFGPGNAVKYVLRRDQKADPVEDLEKAIWYLTDSLANGINHERTDRLAELVWAFSKAERNVRVAYFLGALMGRAGSTDAYYEMRREVMLLRQDYLRARAQK